jgi:hypothetical protein
MADENQRIGISYTGFCLTSLPHKRLPDDQTWEKKGHRVTLWVEPGRMKARGKVVTYGVPYGARARMILLYLQTQAVRIKSREVALGRSMRDWMERMGLSVGGETARELREQAARISACTFNAALRDHPVPLLEAAIRQLRDRSMSLDIYVWLAWRCHQLGKPTPISWPAIHAQFGAGFKTIKHFKPSFVEALSAATAAYPEARVEVGESGVTLHPARPPLARLVG